MTPLEAAQSRHFLTERHKGFRLCAACLMSWPCDFALQRAEAFRVQAVAEGLAAALGRSTHRREQHLDRRPDGEARKARGYCSVCDALAAFEDAV